MATPKKNNKKTVNKEVKEAKAAVEKPAKPSKSKKGGEKVENTCSAAVPAHRLL